MAARNDTFVKPFFELLRKNITKKSSYHLIPDGRRIRQLNLLTLGIDHLFFHDDWGTQLAPFFSLDTCREMLVPAMVEANMDAWCGQPMCDKFALWDNYGDKIAIGIAFSGDSDEDLFRQVDAMMEHIKSDPIRRRMYVRDRMLGSSQNLKEYLKEKTAPLYK